MLPEDTRKLVKALLSLAIIGHWTKLSKEVPWHEAKLARIFKYALKDLEEAL